MKIVELLIWNDTPPVALEVLGSELIFFLLLVELKDSQKYILEGLSDIETVEGISKSSEGLVHDIKEESLFGVHLDEILIFIEISVLIEFFFKFWLFEVWISIVR